MKKGKIHYSLWNVCVSFVSACTLRWSYETNLFKAQNTDDESKVTCKKCIKALQWLNKEDYPL